jgi:hypothetical protein
VPEQELAGLLADALDGLQLDAVESAGVLGGPSSAVAGGFDLPSGGGRLVVHVPAYLPDLPVRIGREAVPRGGTLFDELSWSDFVKPGSGCTDLMTRRLPSRARTFTDRSARRYLPA